MPPTPEADAAGALAAIERFLTQAGSPALLEPGDELLPLSPDSYALEMRGSRLTLQAWDRTRNLVRRIVRVEGETKGRLQLTIQRFAGKEGSLFLLDLARPASAGFGRRNERLVFRERFRLFLRRQFPEWTLSELSAEANLEQSLSPAFPRAFLRHGQHGFAAIAAPPESEAAHLLSFGLIWLSYLRRREKRVSVEGLALYVPSGFERSTALCLLCLNPASARFELFGYTPDDVVNSIDPRDYGNLDTRVEPCRRPAPHDMSAWNWLTAVPGVEAIARHDSRTSLRVRGLEFAEISGGHLRFGLTHRRLAEPHHTVEIQQLAGELNRVRSAGSDRDHPLYRQAPEAWLESMVRANIETIDANLLPDPIYGQVPAMAAGDRGILDLLACGRDGRLAVLELKASADIHLPLQALDYWLRVKWHLDRGEFTLHGYFPGQVLEPAPPRVLLISPSLEFHPATESILEFLAPSIEVARIGLGVEWRKELQVMFRLTGAEHP